MTNIGAMEDFLNLPELLEMVILRLPMRDKTRVMRVRAEPGTPLFALLTSRFFAGGKNLESSHQQFSHDQASTQANER